MGLCGGKGSVFHLKKKKNIDSIQILKVLIFAFLELCFCFKGFAAVFSCV